MLATILLSLPSFAASGERTRVLFVGSVELPQGIRGGAFYHLQNDPFFGVTPVRAMWLPGGQGHEDEVIQKAVRLYMPRRYEDLVEKYDVVSISYASRDMVDSKFAKWFSDAVLGGKGFTFAGHGGQWGYDWMSTTVGEILPAELLNSQYTQEPTRIRIVNDDNPLTAGLPWSRMGEHAYLDGHSYMNVKVGAEVVAELVPPIGPAAPFLVWWDVGQGRSIAMMSVFSTDENPFLEWDYAPDFFANKHLFAAGREIPPDPEILHEIRLAKGHYRTRSGLLVSLVEFVSKLGGDPASVEQIMSQANGRLRDVETLYLDYDFEGSLGLVQESIADLDRAEQLSMELKDRTLFWIYLIEWSILTSTSLVAGGLIWALMVKRQLYAEVRSTRLARFPAESLTTRGDVG